MNEPIRPRSREQGRYRCWIAGHQQELDATPYDYLNWRASPNQAALDFCDDLVDHGRHQEFVGHPLTVMVRDLVNGGLTSVPICWEYEAHSCIAPGEEQVEAQRGGVAYG